MGILSGNEHPLLFQEQTVSGGCALQFPDPKCQISYETVGLLLFLQTEPVICLVYSGNTVQVTVIGVG